MRNIKLLIEYEGTRYSGWQTQDNAISIQQTMEDAIEKVTGERTRLIGSGRTDGRVHALGQVANFFTNEKVIPGSNFKYPLNAKLPPDIKVLKSEDVDLNFHARFNATKKKYRYLIYYGEMPRPIYRNFSYHVYGDLDIDKMIISSKQFIGTHDFKSFMGPKSVVDTTVRTIYDIDIAQRGELIEITVKGKSFLRHMIRIMVGTLVHIGLGKIPMEDLGKIIHGRDRTLAGPTAPPQGLFLEKVYYD